MAFFTPFGPYQPYGYRSGGGGYYDPDEDFDPEEAAAYERARRQQANRRPQYAPSPFGAYGSPFYDEAEEYRRQQAAAAQAQAQARRQQQLRQEQLRQERLRQEAIRQEAIRQEQIRRAQAQAHAQAQAQARAQAQAQAHAARLAQERAAQAAAQLGARQAASQPASQPASPPPTSQPPSPKPAAASSPPASAKPAMTEEQAAAKIQHAYKTSSLRSSVDSHLPSLAALSKIANKRDNLLSTYLDEALSTPLVFQHPSSADSTKLNFTAKENKPFLLLEDGLMKLLIELDGVSAAGSQEIRHLRKAMVGEIQSVLDKLDAKKKGLPLTSEPAATAASDDVEMKADAESSEQLPDLIEESNVEPEIEMVPSSPAFEVPPSEAGAQTGKVAEKDEEMQAAPVVEDPANEPKTEKAAPQEEIKAAEEPMEVQAEPEPEKQEAAAPVVEEPAKEDVVMETAAAEPEPEQVTEATQTEEEEMPPLLEPAQEIPVVHHGKHHQHHKHKKPHRPPSREQEQQPKAQQVKAPAQAPTPLKPAPTRNRSQPPPASPDVAVPAPRVPQHPSQQFHTQSFPFQQPQYGYRRMPSPQPQLPPGYVYDPFGNIYKVAQPAQQDMHRGRPRGKVYYDPRTGGYYRDEDDGDQGCGIQ